MDISHLKVMQKLHERLDKGTLSDDIKITLRVAGGMPHERNEEEYIVYGSGRTILSMKDVQKMEFSAELNKSILTDFFRRLEEGLDSLATRSNARFLPDSLIGSITIDVAGEKTTLYYLAKEEDQAIQRQQIAPQINEYLQHLRKMYKKCLEQKES
jgi:hypothetical protein